MPVERFFAKRIMPAVALICACLFLGAAGADAGCSKPGAPVIGTATLMEADSASVTFSPPSSDGGCPITSYTVQSSPGSIQASGASSPLAVSGLVKNTTYKFEVKATNSNGSGPWSAWSNNILTPNVPGAPTIGTATAGDTQALVNCTPPSSDGGDPIESYAAISSPGSKTGQAASCPVIVSGLTNGAAYTFKVTASNGVGTSSQSGSSNSITPTSNVSRIGTATAGNASATVSFNPPSGGGPYSYYTATSSPGNITATNTSSPITVSGLTNGTAYKFTVTAAYTSGGTTQPSFPSNSVTPTGPPVTTASPAPGTYVPPLSVTLTASTAAPPAVIYYTTDGSTPTTSSPAYTSPIQVSATTTIKYFAVDENDVQEPVNSGTWTIHSSDMTASMYINNGAGSTKNMSVTLTISAYDPEGISTMQFSNDNATYSSEEPYSTSKAWTLTSGDGAKSVYMRLKDSVGYLYPPLTAEITLDTAAPATTASPIPGSYSAAPVHVTLAANEAAAVHYTTDGSTPTEASSVYTGPIPVSSTTTIKYFSVDTAGNAELVRSGTWKIQTSPDTTAGISINNGAGFTGSTAVTLALGATDPDGIVTMQFSNDGTAYTPEEPYATSKTWSLTPGDGLKTVYVRFRDGSLPSGYLSPPATASITLDTIAPATSASPVTGPYSTSPVNVVLTVNEAAAIYYTTDGTTPTSASPVYGGPISVSATTTIEYFAVDMAGNAEAVKSGTWTIHTSPDMTESALINNGAGAANNTAVTLTLSAYDPDGIATMQFSNDNVNWSAEEPYAISKAWNLTPGDGLKTVYVRFRDGSLPNGRLYDPVTAEITYTTVPPVTTASPTPGTYAVTPLSVTLAPDKPATVYYTVDGTAPTTQSAVYSGPIQVSATTTIRYFGIDAAGNIEMTRSGMWIIHGSPDMTASVLINGGAAATNNAAVTLTLSAYDPAGIAAMQFSNDNITYTAEEPYAASKAWTLAPGDGSKTVYVRFRDSALPVGFLYPPVTANTILNTTAPVTTANPAPGTYSTGPVSVALTASETSTIHYTIDGTTPTTASSVYSAPIQVYATTTIKYFAIDIAGNVEAVRSGAWTIHTSDLTASVLINGGAAATNNTAVTLTLSAYDPTGIATMQFSNDNVNWSAEEPYSTSKAWNLVSGDGPRTVYVRFRDNSQPSGFLYPPVTAAVVLDTVVPTTTASPVPGIYVSSPVSVTLTTTEPATIYYTTDGTAPTTASSVCTGPISVSATTTIKYFSVDPAGNAEAVMSDTWTIHASDMTANILINNGSPITKSPVVTLALYAYDPTGIATMQFSGDGVNYTPEEPYATSRAWTLAAGDGINTVYVRFRDKAKPAGILYPPVTASIVLDTAAPVTTAGPVSGVYVSAPVMVSLTSNKPATVYYTVDGTTPTVSSNVFAAPVPVSATTTIRYFAVDLAGNAEAVKTGTWTIHKTDMTASLAINGGASATNSTSATLSLNAVDPQGIATMQFSADGVNYTAEEPYASLKAWILAAGDGLKSVYVRFRDKALPGGNLYPPVSASIMLDTVVPTTTATPVPGTYTNGPLTVTLAADKQATTYYTTDGTTPTTASAVYSGPVSLSTTTAIKYFSVDTAGTAEPVRSGTWAIHSIDMNASVLINGGGVLTNNPAVTLTLAAVDPAGIATMQFSNDGIHFTEEEPYKTGKAWTLSAGDGLKAVFVRFRDKSLPAGNLYDPVTAYIMLDTAAPSTTASPVPGNYAGGVSVSLSANKPAAIYYTTNGSDPTTASSKYTGPIPVSTATVIRYFAVDTAGNAEAVNTGVWTAHTSDLIASVKINGGAAFTNKTAVSLFLDAKDPLGIATMQFSNDGANYTDEEAYATNEGWCLDEGDGVKTIYVRFRDKSLPAGNLYDPVVATITLDTVAPTVTASPAPGIYAGGPLAITLSADEEATIHYTIDGSAPTAESAVYKSLSINATATVKYLAVDRAGNAGTVGSGTWVIETSGTKGGVKINGGSKTINAAAVALTLSADNAAGIATMQFSNDGKTYTEEEPYKTYKSWTLDPGDGIKTVYVRFRDKTLPGGVLSAPFTASTTLSTVPPVTTASPVPGTYASSPVVVSLAADETSTIYYTTDDSPPTMSSAVYSGPLSLKGTTTLSYFSVDIYGNTEDVKSGTWTAHVSDMAASIRINGGAHVTANPEVMLTLSATDPLGIATMQFSNDGAAYTAEEPYSESKTWTLTSGDGQKTVYVRFRDKALPAGNLYDPVTASIRLNTEAEAYPERPGKLTAATSPVSADPPRVTLNWIDKSDDEEGFTIQRSTDARFKGGLTAFTVEPDLATFTDSTVKERRIYFYRIRAFNTAGVSKFSNVAKVATKGRLPEAPNGLVVTDSGKKTITISWDDHAVNEQGFHVERAGSAGGVWKRIAKLKSNATSYTNKGLPKNTTYWYRVQAYNAAGVSGYSDAISGKTK